MPHGLDTDQLTPGLHRAIAELGYNRALSLDRGPTTE